MINRKERIDFCMRRERRGFRKDQLDMKRVLYIAGGILSLAVIAFVAIFILYGGGNSAETQMARYNSSIVEEYVSNTTEETSSQMGRTVNEVQETETNELQNEVTNELETSTEEDTTKYAVNTSKSETNAVAETNSEANNTTENNTVEEETVKDPEFIMPVEGEILREYAKDNLVYSTTLDEWITHNGIDITAEKTTVVKASAEGTVKSIKNDPRYGLTVVIEHVNGFETVYSNLLTAEFVEEGETVEQGQTIGTVGNTATFEIADESHLHFEILKDSEYLDPELYVK